MKDRLTSLLPTKGLLFLLPAKPDDKTEGGLLLINPDTSMKNNLATVIAVGPECRVRYVPQTGRTEGLAQVGDRVLFRSSQCMEFKSDDGKTSILMAPEEAIKAVWPAKRDYLNEQREAVEAEASS